jgi:hypothetical protein
MRRLLSFYAEHRLGTSFGGHIFNFLAITVTMKDTRMTSIVKVAEDLPSKCRHRTTHFRRVLHYITYLPLLGLLSILSLESLAASLCRFQQPS